MKRNYIIATLLAVGLLAGCSKDPKVGMVQQCGLDQDNNQQCVWVHPNQAQQQQYAQQQYQQPQVIQQPAPVVVNGGGDAALGMAVGMMAGQAMANSNSSLNGYDRRMYDEPRRVVVEKKTVYVNQPTPSYNKAPPVNLVKPGQLAVTAPMMRPSTVNLQKTTPSYAPRNTIQPKMVVPTPRPVQASSYAPRNVVTPKPPTYKAPTYKAPSAPRQAAPVRVSSSSSSPKSFTVTKTSSSNTSSFKR